ncbi:MAG: DUF4062 domain-containing protein [Saprospiraceae bacterium]|nr:DUF4062 domain-containing protein [Saprospiraceae bacterium]
MENSSTPILTPDQRLRVFVSSTLQELAEERTAVKQAIQQIHLTPVMFEMGARPHAPRNLYRQYLAQSQIFVGIYWERYGWVAPEETVSGLEDEYNLSGNMPKLIYIKQTTGQREDKLSQLIERIQQDDKVSYKTFTNAKELGDLIVNDLALLMTERFNLTLQNKLSEAEYKAFDSLPALPNPIIGREKNIQEIISLLEEKSTRLVTLTGPGGIGKTRLAIATASRLQHTFEDGVAYIPLAPVRDHNLVTETICYQLGLKVSGNILESLKLFLQEKNLLLVLDNFEQVVEAASIIDDLLYAAPGLKILVTSRERLALSFEHTYIVPSLLDTCPEGQQDENDIPPTVQLFLQRAKAIQPSFTINAQNREIIFKICRRLEGLPLAIELAAGQINLFGPALLLQKLDHSLDVLKGTFRDIPDRQKTMRNTIEWSYLMLSEAEQNLLLRMSLFNGGCLIPAIEYMEETGEADVYVTLGSLINKSLIVRQEEENNVRFQMLEYIREFALEQLTSNGKLDAYRECMAAYYHRSLNAMKLERNSVNQKQILHHLEAEHSNIRLAMNYLLQKKDLQKITEMAWNLWLFWWINAHTKEGYTWLKSVWEFYKDSDKSFDDHTFALLATNVGTMSFLQRDLKLFNESIVKHLDLIRKQNDDELIATASLITGVVKTIVHDYEGADYMLRISLERYKKIKLTTGISLALSALGRNLIYNGNKSEEAKKYYKESMELAKQDQNEISVIICLSGFALCEVMLKNSDAKNYLRESLLMSQSIHFYEALAWSLEIWALVSINEGKLVHAVTLMGAVDHLRSTTQLPVWDDLHAVILDANNQLHTMMEPEIFEKAWNEGTAMTLDGMVAYAMEEQVRELSKELVAV